MKNFVYFIQFEDETNVIVNSRPKLLKAIDTYVKNYNIKNDERIYSISINSLDDILNKRLKKEPKIKYVKFLGRMLIEDLISIDKTQIKYQNRFDRPFCEKYISKQKQKLLKKQYDIDKNNITIDNFSNLIKCH